MNIFKSNQKDRTGEQGKVIEKYKKREKILQDYFETKNEEAYIASGYNSAVT